MSQETETVESITHDYEEDLAKAVAGGNYEEDARHAFFLHRSRLELLKKRTDPNYKPPKEWYEK